VLQCVAVCCSVLRRVAQCCSRLWIVLQSASARDRWVIMGQMHVRIRWTNTHVHLIRRTNTHVDSTYYNPAIAHYGVATTSRLLQIIGLFCKRAL